ncbi:TPA: hypothetical protein ACKP33_001922 [Serratia marcescens]
MTLTTERMAEIAKLAIRLQQISGCAAVTSSGETIMHHTFVDTILSALHDVTAELLANREAQPVGYIDQDSLKEYRGQRAGGTWSAVQRTTSGLNMTTPIYIAPPAPAVPAVPDKPRLPPHVYRDLLDMLQETAIAYGGTQQLRAQLSSALSIHVQPDHPHTRAAMLKGERP